MISIDTNLLFHAVNPESRDQAAAAAFLASLGGRDDVGVSELVLVEFYLLLRNPAVFRDPLDADEAVEMVAGYRRHPHWTLFGFPPGSVALHDRLWRLAGQPGLARRRIFDLRLALTLQAYGVTEFATVNVRDFDDLGFRRVWNPLEQETS